MRKYLQLFFSITYIDKLFFKSENRLSLGYTTHIFVRSTFTWLLLVILFFAYDYYKYLWHHALFGEILDFIVMNFMKIILIIVSFIPIFHSLNIGQNGELKKSYIRRFISLIYGIFY